MAKLKYVFDENKVLVNTDFVSNDYVLLDNETFNAPEPGLNTPVKMVDGKWVGSTEPEIVQFQSNKEPSAEMQAINALGLQVMTLMAAKEAE